jgi:hypothetical protein
VRECARTLRASYAGGVGSGGKCWDLSVSLGGWLLLGRGVCGEGRSLGLQESFIVWAEDVSSEGIVRVGLLVPAMSRPSFGGEGRRHRCFLYDEKFHGFFPCGRVVGNCSRIVGSRSVKECENSTPAVVHVITGRIRHFISALEYGDCTVTHDARNVCVS